MTVKQVEMPFEEGLLLASATFAPIIGCSAEEFYDLIVYLDKNDLLSEDLKWGLCHPYEFEKSDIKETISLKEALKGR